MAAGFDVGIVDADATIWEELSPLHLDNRVSLRWDWRPRHDPRRRAWTQHTAGRLARCDFLDYWQCALPAWKVGQTHGVAVHHRFIEGRHIEVACHILG